MQKTHFESAGLESVGASGSGRLRAVVLCKAALAPVGKHKKQAYDLADGEAVGSITEGRHDAGGPARGR